MSDVGGEGVGRPRLVVDDAGIPGVKVITPPRFGDERGFFAETYNRRAFTEAGIDAEFVQDNHSRSARQGTVRGLHYQLAPSAQGKLVRVVRGAILDVAVDIRRSSATFGRHVAVTLSGENFAQLWIPEGFAHGFCTLMDDTEVLYKTTGYYDPARERGIRWDDPALGIEWPIPAEDVTLSKKDAASPPLSEQSDLFE
jgi:dTDP-4-dehydrorhamnose 3,5-epimerase